MVLHPESLMPVPEETARVARAAHRKGSLCMRIRDKLGPIFADESFSALFSHRGQPAASPARLAMVLVLQFVEGLTDRQAPTRSDSASTGNTRSDWN